MSSVTFSVDATGQEKVVVVEQVNYLGRAEAAGLGWPLPAEIDEQELEGLLFSSQKSPQEARRPLPAMEAIHKELRGKRRCKGVTLQLLWEEYRAGYPGGYGYTQFCEYYKRFVSKALSILAHRLGRAVYFMLTREKAFDMKRFLSS